MDAATVLAYFQSVLLATNMSVVEYPPSYNAIDGEFFDFIIIGCGTAGSVLANRLSEISDWSVLCIEAGTAPSVYTQLPGIFPFLPHTKEDWDYYSEDDGITSQGLTGKRVAFTRGKVLGGSSTIDHTVYERGTKIDYDYWKLFEKSFWNYNTMYKYFKKSEQNIDSRIMNGPTAKYHSAGGMVTVNEQNNQSYYRTTEALMMNMFEELNLNREWDINVPTVNGTAPVSVTVTKNGIRASAAHEYILPLATKSNFHWMEKSHVTKIIFKNITAVGVVVQTEFFEIKLYAKQEVILSAGVFNSAQLLMLSGIGPKEDLETLNIPVIKDLPVGRTLTDHVTAIMHTCGNISTSYTMEELASTADLTTMPLPITNAMYTLGDYSADFQHITLHFTPKSSLFYYFNHVDLNYNKEMTDRVIEQCGDREIFTTMVVLAKPISSGNVTLKSADPSDTPKIYTGYYSDKSDLDRMVTNLKLFYQLQNTSYFQEIGGYFARPTLPACDCNKFASDEYWACYAKFLATSNFHPACTNAMGIVVDSKLKVMGTNNLRVCDDSVMPSIPAAKTRATTIAITELLSDLIKKEYGYANDAAC